MKHESCPKCWYILTLCSFCGASKCKGCSHICAPEAVKAYQEQQRTQARIKMRGYRANRREAIAKAMQPAVVAVAPEPAEVKRLVDRAIKQRSRRHR